MSNNPLRENMIRAAVARTTFANEAIAVENVRKYLPGPNALPTAKGVDGALLIEQPDFELDDSDIAPWQAEPLQVEDNRPADTVAADAEPEPPAEPELPREVRFGNASTKLHQLEVERADLRVALDAAVKAEMAARLERDKIAHAFVAGFGAPITQEQLIRQHIASENEHRRAVKAGELPGRRSRSGVGPSMVDRYAAAQRGGNPAFAGGGYRRGASPANKRTMAGIGVQAQGKLPSER